MKYAIVEILRKLKLLSAADYINYKLDIINNFKNNRLFKSKHPDFAIPPSPLSFDAFGTVNLDKIYSRGLKTANEIGEIINNYFPVNQKLNILEWGCGPGRVLRNLPAICKNNRNIYFGSDYNKTSIEWCKNNLSGINFITNELEPPIKLDDSMFDVIYSVSVFTHLSEKLHYDWIRELNRLLKPNGILIITTNGDYYRDKHLLNEEKYKYDHGELIVRGEIMEGKKWFTAYHSPKFIRTKLLKEMDIVDHLLRDSTQDIWVARKN